MEFLSGDLVAYLEDHCPAEPELLKRLDRETNLTVPYPNMLTGHVQGRFLAFISKLLRPRYILEIGTYTGYSAICFAEGLAEGGHIHTIDKNPEVEEIAIRYFREAGLENVITRYEGKALEIIPKMEESFDLIFLDADKENYPEYLGICKEKLNPNGLLLVDNTLWGGKVLHKLHSGDQETKGITLFNKMVKEDPELDSFLLPLRDGITMIRLK
ncbi:MAG: O-methyltransferase [Bacteroidota bacterium]